MAMRKHITASVGFLVLSLALGGCASMEPQLTSARVLWQDDHSRIEVAFNDSDRRQIHDYYSRRGHGRKHLPPGLAKKKSLPPGLHKHVVRNGKLPPGLARRALPGDLERRLSPVPDNYVRLKVGGDIVLMNRQTQVVMDVIYDVAGAQLSSADD
jgi:hypothetical protein